MSKDIDQEVGAIKATLDKLTDETITTENGSELLIHHLGGDQSNKLVIGTSKKGKSFINMYNSKTDKT